MVTGGGSVVVILLVLVVHVLLLVFGGGGGGGTVEVFEHDVLVALLEVFLLDVQDVEVFLLEVFDVHEVDVGLLEVEEMVSFFEVVQEVLVGLVEVQEVLVFFGELHELEEGLLLVLWEAVLGRVQEVLLRVLKVQVVQLVVSLVLGFLDVEHDVELVFEDVVHLLELVFLLEVLVVHLLEDVFLVLVVHGVEVLIGQGPDLQSTVGQTGSVHQVSVWVGLTELVGVKRVRDPSVEMQEAPFG